MKSFLYLVYIFFVCCNFLLSQNDPNNNPNWSWLEGPSWKLFHSDFPSGIFISPSNPFYQDGIGAAVYDNKIEDGWVLLKRDFGTETRHIPLPYLIIYNKYQGIIRIFVYLRIGMGYEVGAIRLSGDNAFDQSVSLTFLDNIAWGRDDLEKVKFRNGAATTPVIHANWAFADFPIAYDATISSKNNARLQFQVWGIQNYNIEIDGLGTMNQVLGQNSPGNVSNVGFFSQGGEFNALSKSVSGTQESWTKWQNTIEKIGDKIPDNSNSSSLIKLKNWTKNVKNTWLIGNLGLIGAGIGIVDFLVTGGRLINKEQPAPMNYLLNFKLKGNMNTEFQVGGGATLPLPGANHTIQYATNLIYNKPLGILNLQKTPILQHRTYWWPTGNGINLLTHSYRSKESLLFDLNPNADLEITSLVAAYVFELTTSSWAQNFLQYADQGFSPIDNSVIELESYNNEKYVFRTPYVNAHTFKYQRITLPAGFKLYIKIKAELKVKGSSNDRQPIIFIATYDANVEEGDGVTSPWPVSPIPFIVNITRVFDFGVPESLEPFYGFIGFDPVTVTSPSLIGNYNFIRWGDGYTLPTRTFTNNTTISSQYKLQSYSDNFNAFSKNNQRKIAKTIDGTLHMVYSSMGKIWYEKSTNNGVNWLSSLLIAENDHESEGAYCRNPAIAAYGNRVGIVYQNDGVDPYAYVPTKLCTREIVDGSLSEEEIIASYTYSANIYPVTSYSSNNFVVVWKPLQTSGFYIKMKDIDLNETWSDILSIPNTNSNSSNPSLFYSEHYSGGTVFDTHVLTWQQYFGESANGPDIRIRTYDNIYGVGAPSYSIVFNGYNADISTGGGFATNQNPAVTVVGGYPMVSWTGINQSQIMEKNDGTESLITKKIIVRGKTSSGWSSTFFTAGDNVEYSNIMGRDNPSISDAIVNWSENNGQQAKFIKRSNGTYQCVSALSSNGIETQLSPASTFSAMKAYVYNNSGNPPYAIVRANNDFSFDVACKRELKKTGNEDDDFELTFGRSGIIVKNDLQFVFNIGDIVLNNEPVMFIERNDTLPVNSIEELNSILKTEPFFLDGNSNLLFSNYFYVLNKEYADSLLGDDDIVSFRSELVKVSTGQVVGTYNTVNYKKTNLAANGHRNYEINCSGIEGGMYYFRLTTQTEGEELYFVANVQGDASVLAKRHYANISYDGDTKPESYALSQNYPNPFNPATIISYQIPADGFVTLKVYDILGKEVVTLVNEQQTMGRYSINFNATHLASGVYIYELRAGEFVQSKKMMLLR